MKTNPSKLGITLAGVLAVSVFPSLVHTNAIAYNVTVLDSLGGSPSYANGINASGQIAAYGTIDGETYALRLDLVAVAEPGTALSACCCSVWQRCGGSDSQSDSEPQPQLESKAQ